jgi:hypothetical protein
VQEKFRFLIYFGVRHLQITSAAEREPPNVGLGRAGVAFFVAHDCNKDGTQVFGQLWEKTYMNVTQFGILTKFPTTLETAPCNSKT